MSLHLRTTPAAAAEIIGKTLICRLIFALVPGTAALERRHARCPTGRPALHRPQSEVMVVGEAHPPPGTWHARLVVGSIDKTVPVHEGSQGKRVAPALGPQQNGAAPGDQRLSRALQHDERIVLEGLHVAHNRFECSLPGIEPQAIARLTNGQLERVALAADLLWIDADAAECVVEWRGELSPESEAVFVAEASAASAAPFEQIVAMAEVIMKPSEPEGAFDTLVTDKHSVTPPLPFAGQRAAPPPGHFALAASTGTMIGLAAVDLDGNVVAPPAMLGDPRATPPVHSWESAPVKRSAVAPVAVGAAARRELEHAARSGVAAVSAAAARQTEPEPVVVRQAPKKGDSPAKGPAFDLLWLDDTAVGRLVEEHGIEPEERPPRNVVAEHLKAAPVASIEELASLYARKIRAEPASRPLVCIEGSLSLCLRSRDRLLRMSDLAELFADNDKRLRSVLDRVAQAASRTTLPEDVIDALRRQLLDAFGPSSRGLAPDYLESTVERGLVEERAFVERTIMGASHLRSIMDDREKSAVVYLPKACADELPLSARFPARLLVEIRSRHDERDKTPVSLKALAVAALLSLTSVSRGNISCAK